jgi:hypothetical protein
MPLPIIVIATIITVFIVGIIWATAPTRRDTLQHETDSHPK